MNDKAQGKSDETKKRVNQQTAIRTWEQIINEHTDRRTVWKCGSVEQRNREQGDWRTGNREQGSRGAGQQGNRGNEEQKNRGTGGQGNMGTEEQSRASEKVHERTHELATKSYLWSLIRVQFNSHQRSSSFLIKSAVLSLPEEVSDFVTPDIFITWLIAFQYLHACQFHTVLPPHHVT